MATSPSPAVAKARAQVAAIRRHRAPDDPALAEAQQNLRAAKLEDHVRKVVAEAPPLSHDARDRIVAILRSGVA